MSQSNSNYKSSGKAATGNRRRHSIVVYSLGINDSQGLSTRAFGDEEAVLQWLADYAEGPDEGQRKELRRLAQQNDKSFFWRFLHSTIPPYVQYRFQCHEVTQGGARR